ncbi:MAG: insulinase family protein [Hyphomonadaceae bacterium]|nr:insulinase family protein [Hyphomonadaceae bacterium]
MNRIFAALILALALAGCATKAPEVPQPAAGALAVAPLQYSYRQLPNGLRVYAMPDPNTANVSVQVWYDVGSKNDPPGRSGFAHLFEHIMFKATRNMPPETMDRLTEDVGGQNNASTADDYTNYYETIPANHLERVLWAEAERMGSLVIDEANFRSERDVVKEEYRQGVLARPYGKLFYLYLAQTAFLQHPYGRPTIGSIEDLDAATVEDVRAFHATYYRPDNAVLVVAGNFDPAQLNAWVDRYFGPIARPDRPIPRVNVQEPPHARDFTVYEPNTPLPAIAITYPAPAARDPNTPALMVLDAIMSTGESSRLYRSMVYEQQVAAEVLTIADPTQDPYYYALGAILSEGVDADRGMASLQAEIARMRDSLATPAELDEAKNELVTAALQERETAAGRAGVLADAVIRYGDPTYADKLLADIQAVTAEDVQRVARAVFDDSKRITVRYLSDEARAPGAPADAITPSAAIQAQALTIAQADIPVYTLAPAAERVAPPQAAAPVSARIPTPSERTLPNGLRVIVVERHDLPLISADLRFLSGAASDPRAGTAALTADLLAKGTAARSATEIARAIESIGASLSAEAGADSSTVSLETRADRVADAFTIFADVARNPQFAAEEVERARRQTLDGLQVALSEPRSLAGFAMTRALYGAAPYGAVPSPASVEAMTRDEIAAFHAAHYRPDNAVLVISGDIAAADGFALAERFLGDWAKPAAALPPEPDATRSAPAPRLIVVDLRESGQAAVSFGFRGVARSDADYFPALVASTVLGGDYSARLNQEIRIKRGLSYGVSSRFSPRLAPGPIVIVAQTRNDAANQVLDLMRTELSRIGAERAAQDELNARRATLIGGFGRSVETTSGLAGQISQLALFNLPLDKLQTYVADVSAVTPEQMQTIAARLFNPANADIVIVGDAKQFYSGVRRRAGNVRPERIPAASLNLDKPELR